MQKKGEDVSAVSQAWFTTKEDKDTLVNKGTFGIFCIYTESVLSYKPSIRNIGPDISMHRHGICNISSGHKWKQGMWSKEEIDLLMSNIEHYLKVSMLYECITFVIFDLHPHSSSVCAFKLRTEGSRTLQRSSLRCRKRSERIFTAV